MAGCLKTEKYKKVSHTNVSQDVSEKSIKSSEPTRPKEKEVSKKLKEVDICSQMADLNGDGKKEMVKLTELWDEKYLKEIGVTVIFL
jgi:hypothetical protein